MSTQKTYVDLGYVEKRLSETENRLLTNLNDMKVAIKADLSEIKEQTKETTHKVEMLERHNSLCDINDVKDRVAEMQEALSLIMFVYKNPRSSKILLVLVIGLLGLNGIKTILEMLSF